MNACWRLANKTLKKLAGVRFRRQPHLAAGDALKVERSLQQLAHVADETPADLNVHADKGEIQVFLFDLVQTVRSQIEFAQTLGRARCDHQRGVADDFQKLRKSCS